MKQKEIQDKIISILEQYVIRGSASDKTIDVPFTGDTKEFITHKTLGEDCDACDDVDQELSEDFLQDEPEEDGYEEGTLDGEVPEDGTKNYEEVDESLSEQKKDEMKPPEMDAPPDDSGTEPAAATPNETGADTGVDTADPTAGGMNDPSMGASIPGMDQGMGMDQMGMGGMEPKTPKDIGRIFELKKIYSRLISIEQYLSFSSDEFLLKLKVYISKAIQLFETLIFNIESFKDKLDDIIVLYYTFVQTVYTVLKDHYEKNDKENKESNNVKESVAVRKAVFWGTAGVASLLVAYKALQNTIRENDSNYSKCVDACDNKFGLTDRQYDKLPLGAAVEKTRKRRECVNKCKKAYEKRKKELQNKKSIIKSKIQAEKNKHKNKRG